MSCSIPHILIVDDLADNLFMLKTFLELQGYSVDTAERGASALEQAQDTLPDLILLDVMMPEMDGYEVTRAIRRHRDLQEIPVILITAYTDTCRIKGLAAGATDFVRKPIDLDELLDKIQTLLTRKRSQPDYSLATFS
jgi:two-component system sensor histidine kinase/response regulator